MILNWKAITRFFKLIKLRIFLLDFPFLFNLLIDQLLSKLLSIFKCNLSLYFGFLLYKRFLYYLNKRFNKIKT